MAVAEMTNRVRRVVESAKDKTPPRYSLYYKNDHTGTETTRDFDCLLKVYQKAAALSTFAGVKALVVIDNVMHRRMNWLSGSERRRWFDVD